MMVTFISECEKKALARTRRVLDSFANRIGSRTWQTVITDQGLQAVHKHLRATASKSTAVSCHWMRSRSRSDLLWIVGNKSKFASDGSVPVAGMVSDSPWVLRENDWQYLPAIKALVAVAALFHDWGKATRCFQEKLRSKTPKGDPLRHEWISCLLLRELVKRTSSTDDSAWLSALAEGNIPAAVENIPRNSKEQPFRSLPPVAQLVTWLVLTHHRLPKHEEKERRENAREQKASSIEDVLRLINAHWGYSNLHFPENVERLDTCFLFEQGLPALSPPWRKHAAKWAKRLLEQTEILSTASPALQREVLSHARLALMLGDHNYSSKEADPAWQSSLNLFANTDQKTREFKQRLDEHLCGVAGDGLRIAHWLPYFSSSLPQAEGLHRLSRRSPKAFSWQDDAVRAIRNWRSSHSGSKTGTRGAFFGINMASTGCGKTFANAKIMRALSHDQQSLRYTLALGLRTLTLQTGDAYRDNIGMDESQLAVVIGSRAVMELHAAGKTVKEELSSDLSAVGSESLEDLWTPEIDFESPVDDELLRTALRSDKERKLLYAPVLCCTIDHIMPATETVRGGRYILPQLRLMSADLVIDEVDDFVGEDLVAIGRLIHLTGLLGRKVLLSSATIPPDLALGFFHAYRAGWQSYAEAHSADRAIVCGWFDEYRSAVETCSQSSSEQLEAYRGLHHRFVRKRIKNLQAAPPRRKAVLISVDSPLAVDETAAESSDDGATLFDGYLETIASSALALHDVNHTPLVTHERRVSFGVVRVANVDPCIEVARRLQGHTWPRDTSVYVMAYHSRQVLLLRSAQERHLDAVLKRHEVERPGFLQDPVVTDRLSASDAKNVIFILVATPVEEVGRDHDFDWAIIEPSSFRSIVQLAGRVMRHRVAVASRPNIGLLQYNLRALRHGASAAKPAFRWPGFESERTRLKSHDLKELLDLESLADRVDAVPRIARADSLEPDSSLVDLEHAVLADALTAFDKQGPEALEGYLSGYWWLTALPQNFNRFRRGERELELFLEYDGEDSFKFSERNERGSFVARESLYKIEHAQGLERGLWLSRDYAELLEERAEKQKLSLKDASRRYGQVMLRPKDSEKGFVYSDDFGMKRKGSWI